MLRVSGVRLALEEETEHLPRIIAGMLGLKASEILEWHIYKQSVDARRKNRIDFVYTVDVSVKNEQALLSRCKDGGVSLTPELNYQFVATGDETLHDPPVIVGAGPAGLFAALLLAQMGYRPLLLERGDDVETRTEKVRRFWEEGSLDTQSNVQFGEGGAGTFSDGKLTTLIKDRRCRKVLEELVGAGAPPEILYSYKPHVGTDILKDVVKSLRTQITSLGGTVLFRSCLTQLILEANHIKGVVVNDRDRIRCQALLLAVGHSARDTFRLLHEQKVQMIPKPFSIGVRIEHPQELINLAQYKGLAGHPRLGAAEYKLVYHGVQGRSAYTFCMCPGGMVVAAASEEGGVVTNGMSEHARAGENANSALLVGVTPEDFPGDSPLAGIEFQRQWEHRAWQMGGGGYRAPAQQVGDFLAGRASVSMGNVIPSYPRGVVPADLRDCLPDYVVNTLRAAILDFAKKLRGFDREDAVLTGVETRSSSPLRILRDDNLEAGISGIYPAGEGAGYAGGIVSAAVDGMRAAEALARRFKPLK